MGAIPDLWGRLLTWALGEGAAQAAAVAALAGLAWLVRRLWRAHTDREAAEAMWRSRIEALIEAQGARSEERWDAMCEAQHVTMRTTLVHNAEKYLSRGWVTPEEKQAWYGMYVAYGTLGLNGFMHSYWDRLSPLPTRQLDEAIRDGLE